MTEMSTQMTNEMEGITTTTNISSTGRENHIVTRLKIAILSYNDARVAHDILSNNTLTQMIRCNHEAYAQRYGYTYLSPDRSSALWSASRFVLNGLRYKTFSILSNFESYDVIVWIDHDAVFYNQALSIEYWLDHKMDAAADLLMAEDLPGYKFNAGLQIIKTSAWARKFYENAIEDILKTAIDAVYLEQPIFYRLHDTMEGASSKIQIYKPRSDFQAFLKVSTDFKNTSWVVHGTVCKSCDIGVYVQPEQCRLRGNNTDKNIVAQKGL
jgi:hypothetical protein